MAAPVKQEDKQLAKHPGSGAKDFILEFHGLHTARFHSIKDCIFT
jgi:hypothetical protein